MHRKWKEYSQALETYRSRAAEALASAPVAQLAAIYDRWKTTESAIVVTMAKRMSPTDRAALLTELQARHPVIYTAAPMQKAIREGWPATTQRTGQEHVGGRLSFVDGDCESDASDSDEY